MAGRTHRQDQPPARRRLSYILLAAGCVGAGALAFVIGAHVIGGKETPARVPSVQADKQPAKTAAAKGHDFWRDDKGRERIDETGLTVMRQAKSGRLAPLRMQAGSFYDGLVALETHSSPDVVTVLQLGDSHIASDHITGELRRLLQARFGDGGRGLMMPGFPFPYYKVPGFRFSKQGQWTAANSLTEDGVYGVTGVSLSASAPDASLSLAKDDGSFASAEIELLAGPGQGTAIVSEGGTPQRVATAAPSRGIVRVPLGGGNGFTIAPAGDGKISVLGWSTGSGKSGVRYINLGIPGASALTTARWDPALVRQDIEALKPALVVLGYGTNEGFQDGLDMAAYEARYVGLVRLIRQAAPKATLLILGPLDGAKLPGYAKFDHDLSLPCRPLSSGELMHYQAFIADRSDALDRWYEPPKLAPVRAVLAKVAQQFHADYFNLASVMGGACAIHAWALAKPPLALPDHVHLTALGYQRIGKAIYDHLMAQYQTHRGAMVASGAAASSAQVTGSIAPAAQATAGHAAGGAVSDAPKSAP
jgi:lysophospholipase L1-like esterase